MGRKLEHTPNSRIRQAIRQLWLRSRERAQALKNQNYTCRQCGKKQSSAKGREFKVEVHHRYGIDWDGVLEFIRERVLQTPDKLEVLCKECHTAEHEKDTPQKT